MPNYGEFFSDFDFFSQSGFSLEELRQSSVDVWFQKLQEEGYLGDTKRASEFLHELSQGIIYQYNALKKRKKIGYGFLPSVGVEETEQSRGLYFDTKKNKIIIPRHLLQALEHLNLKDDLVMRSNSDEVAFQGTVAEFWFLGGVEEITHAFDSDFSRAPERRISDESITIYEYHAQKHEYKALGWQLHAIVQNQLSGKTKDFHAALLQKVIEFKRKKK